MILVEFALFRLWNDALLEFEVKSVLLHQELLEAHVLELFAVDVDVVEVDPCELSLHCLLVLLLLRQCSEEQPVFELFLPLCDHLGEPLRHCVANALKELSLLHAEDRHRVLGESRDDSLVTEGLILHPFGICVFLDLDESVAVVLVEWVDCPLVGRSSRNSRCVAWSASSSLIEASATESGVVATSTTSTTSRL